MLEVGAFGGDHDYEHVAYFLDHVGADDHDYEHVACFLDDVGADEVLETCLEQVSPAWLDLLLFQASFCDDDDDDDGHCFHDVAFWASLTILSFEFSFSSWASSYHDPYDDYGDHVGCGAGGSDVHDRAEIVFCS